MDSYLVCDGFDRKSKNCEFWTRERWRNYSTRWHHLHRYTEFKYIKISKFWKSGLLASQVEVCIPRVMSGWGGRVSFCLFRDPYRFCLYLFLVLLHAVWTSNNKWLLIFDWELFLFLSGQHHGNFLSTDHPDRQKKFRMDCVIPCQLIFQTQRGYR